MNKVRCERPSGAAILRWVGLAGLGMAAGSGAMAQHQFLAFDAVRIPSTGTMGPGSSYPDLIPVRGVHRPITQVRIIMTLTHTYPDDIDMVLVSPRGQAVVLMSDAGGATDFFGTLIFEPGAPPVPDNGALAPFSHYSDADYEPGDPIPGLPAGVTFTTLAGLAGSDANGYWRLYIVDDAADDSGSVDPPRLLIDEAYQGPMSFGETTVISIPDNQSVVERTLTVSGMDGPIHNMMVRIMGLTHTFPGDLDITVEDPQGQQYIVMSDVGSGGAVNNISLDIGPFPTPMGFGTLTTGGYAPTNLNDGGPLDLGGVTGFALSEGRNPNGQWKLRVVDDAAQDTGYITGWSLVFNAPCPADFNRSGGSSVQDLFDFLDAWFAGCP